MPSNFRLHPGPSEHYVTRFSILSKSVFLILAISPVRLKPQVLHHFLGVTILMSDFFKASATPALCMCTTQHGPRLLGCDLYQSWSALQTCTWRSAPNHTYKMERSFLSSFFSLVPHSSHGPGTPNS